MAGAKSRLRALHLFQEFKRLVPPADREQYVPFVSQDGSGSRIQGLGPINLRQGFGPPVESKQRARIPMMGNWIVGVEFDGAAEFALAGGDIPHAKKRHKGEGS